MLRQRTTKGIIYKTLNDLNKAIYKHSYYSWNNPAYAELMLCVLDNLEPRYLDPHAYLVSERQPAVEMFFITKGHVDVGFLNNYQMR